MYNEAADLSFDWDEKNVSHIARHRIEPSEVEELFRNDPVVRDHDVRGGEDRWTVVGSTNALRALVVVFTVRYGGIRVVTGWPADRRTAREYFAERGM